ncbi:MAG: hypothetical protein EAZ40_07815 [Rhodobacterales bacterium]|nr:MAG: hypothetical protein EAZ40_07815 [Rhodobacterales bacterium]
MVPNLKKTAALALLIAAPLALTVGAAPFPLAIGPENLGISHDLSLTETHCDARATVQATLGRDFAETPRLAALTGTGLTMELWTSDHTGSWTVVHHGGDGISCIVSTGMGWAAGLNPAVVLDTALRDAVYTS